MFAVRNGGLTYAQHEWVQWIPADSPTSFEDNIWTVLPADDVPLDRAVAAVRDILERHEGLRSLVERTAGRQHVCDADDRLGEVVRITDADPLFDDQWRRVCFRVGKQWPIQVVLYATGRSVARIGIVVDHVAIDPWGMTVLRRDLIRALEAPLEDENVEQPIDVAEAETSPAGVAYQQRALSFWEQRLTHLAEALDGRTPSVRPEAKPTEARFRTCRLPSRRAADAARKITRATGVPPSGAFLLAYGTAIRTVEKAEAVGLFAISANRTTARAAESVRKATMTIPMIIEAPHESYRAALSDCAAQQLRGHRFANADPRVTERLCHEILGDHYETAVAYPRFSYIADPGVAVGSLGAGESGKATFSEPRSLGARFMLTVTQNRRGAFLDLEWSDESGWGAHAEDMLLHIEELMIQAAG